jgi:hypothetical protein
MSIPNAINQHELPIAASTNDTNAPAANTNAVITYSAAGAGQVHVLSGVAWSYTGGTPAGLLKVEDGAGNVVFQLDLAAAGTGQVNFLPPKKGSANTALVITLTAGGAGITGKVNALGHWTETSSGV